MLGVKIKTVKTKNEYTIEEFYDAIKDKSFSAGAPALTKHGFSTIVTFPPLDRRNQIWIIPVVGVGKSKTNKFQLSKQEIAGAGNAVVNTALNDLTGGLLNMRGVFSKNTKTAEKLIDITVEELNALGL
ncbi:MAG: hypothetical protein LIV24_03345 [Eubacterium sp.]|nr:hypothetical protein [Eubacterium sp.]